MMKCQKTIVDKCFKNDCCLSSKQVLPSYSGIPEKVYLLVFETVSAGGFMGHCGNIFSNYRLFVPMSAMNKHFAPIAIMCNFDH